MWECPKCSEQVEDAFELCWNCLTSKDGSEPETGSSEDLPVAEPSFQAERKPRKTKIPKWAQRANQRRKVFELGVFAIGIGVINAVLSIQLLLFLMPQRSDQIFLLIVSLAISAVFIILGGLTLALRNRFIVLLTASVLVLSILAKLFVNFGYVRLAIFTGVILLIVITADAATLKISDE